MNVPALVDKLSSLTGEDRAKAMSDELAVIHDECTSAVVALARHAHGDERIADTMEGLALTLDRVEALMHTLLASADDDQEATR